MSQPLNCTTLTGQVHGPCEVKTSKAGKPYAQFKFLSIRDVRGTIEETELQCMAFGGLAEVIAANVRNPFFIAGRLKTERWEYQGKQYSKLILAIDDAMPLAHADDAGATQTTNEAPAQPAQVATAPAATDEPPF